MIQIQQLKISPNADEAMLIRQLSKACGVRPEEILEYRIIKKSIDARYKPEIYVILSCAVSLTDKQEKRAIHMSHGKITPYIEKPYVFPSNGTKPLCNRPVIIGAGPAGLFCAYFLSKAGFKPLIVERGECMEQRTKTVDSFWKGNPLNSESNVQFGEGGAGTFSDGKLNTLVKDKEGRGMECLRIFHQMGAPECIMYDSKPHIGTEVLKEVIMNLRKEIILLGGTFCFSTKLTAIHHHDQSLTGITIVHTKEQTEEYIPCNLLITALGHSARDTIRMLYESGMAMEQKSFAVGLRIQHSQELINTSQYGENYQERYNNQLPPAPYKLTAQTECGRGVYSFCMCPGGYVVNASSEKGRLAVNGMSYAKRDGIHANSAIVVTVSGADFQDESPLAGICFQEQLEERAFSLGNGSIPVSFYGDYKNHKFSSPKEDYVDTPSVKGAFAYSDLRSLLPEELNQAIIEGMEKFNRQIKGFADERALLLGPESRTSSPVRMIRNEAYVSNIDGIYPCGEGAGYAGGIMSAAMDGIKIAEKIAETFTAENISYIDN